jgi:restriction endonuclease S subunit
MKILKIGEFADVQFGPHLKAAPKGEIKYLLAGHFDENFNLSNFQNSFVSSSSKTERFLLQSNDVILAGKGHRTFAWAYIENMGPMVPSSLFYLLSASKDLIIGEYLAAVLNSEKLQHKLGLIGAGATVTSIPKKELNQLEIHIPSIKEQHNFLDVYNLLEKDIELTEKLLQEKRTLKRGLVNELLTNKYKR